MTKKGQKYAPRVIKSAIYENGKIIGYACKGCGELKAVGEYYFFRGKRMTAYCKKCRRQLLIELVYDEEGILTAKQCRGCNKVLPLERFYNSPTGRGKRVSVCKECVAGSYIASKTKVFKEQS